MQNVGFFGVLGIYNSTNSFDIRFLEVLERCRTEGETHTANELFVFGILKR